MYTHHTTCVLVAWPPRYRFQRERLSWLNSLEKFAPQVFGMYSWDKPTTSCRFEPPPMLFLQQCL